MKKSKGFIGYIVILISFIIMATILNGGLLEPAGKRIEYPELLSLIEEGKVEAVAIRNNSLVGLLKDTKIKDKKTFPETRYDFETTIGANFTEDVRQLIAQKNGIPLEQVTVNDFGFQIQYRAPIVVPSL